MKHFVISMLAVMAIGFGSSAIAYDSMTINGDTGEVCYVIGSVVICN